MDSGILDYLMPGDEVMANQGFNIKDLLFEMKVKLVMPSFTKKHRPLRNRWHALEELYEFMLKVQSDFCKFTKYYQGFFPLPCMEED